MSDSKMTSDLIMWNQVDFYKRIVEVLCNNSHVLNNQDIAEILKIEENRGSKKSLEKVDL